MIKSTTSSSYATGVYSNTEIRKAINSGVIIVRPFIEKHINGSSIDVTLGSAYYETDRETDFGIYNPYNPEEVAEYFGQCKEAKPLKEYKVAQRANLTSLVNIPEDHPVILIGPGERILAHTHEFIGIKAPGTSSMQARSTTGRNGVAVCIDAGWGDPGYINRWTMEIMNLNKRHYVPLPVGERIAQLVFYHTGPVEDEYATLSGKYQNQGADNLETLIREWQPSQMLPQAWKDKRSLPKTIDP